MSTHAATELTREAARLFAEKGYHGTSIGDLAEAMGVQKGSLYAHIDSKQDLLYEAMREGAEAFHAALDAIPEELPATEKIRLALRGHLRVVAEQLDVATVFVQRVALPRGRAARGVRRRAAPLRGAHPRALPRGPRARRAAHRPRRRTPPRCSSSRRRTGPTRGCGPGADTDALADRFYALLVDGMRGYSTPE